MQSILPQTQYDHKNSDTIYMPDESSSETADTTKKGFFEKTLFAIIFKTSDTAEVIKAEKHNEIVKRVVIASPDPIDKALNTNVNTDHSEKTTVITILKIRKNFLMSIL